MINLTVKIEAGDLYDYMLMHSYNSPAGLLGSTFGAVLIIFAFATTQWIFAVLGVVMLLYLPWTLFVKSRRQILTKLSGAAPIYAGRGRPDRLSGGGSGEDGLGKHA